MTERAQDDEPGCAIKVLQGGELWRVAPPTWLRSGYALIEVLKGDGAVVGRQPVRVVVLHGAVHAEQLLGLAVGGVAGACSTLLCPMVDLSGIPRLMPALPWTPGSTAGGSQSVALCSRLPLMKKSSTWFFLKQVGLVRKQLRTAPGLVGYSLDAHPLSGQYLTLSVWRSQEATDAFVSAEPHHSVMGALAGKLSKTQFCSWTVEDTSSAPNWDDAKRRLAAS